MSRYSRYEPYDDAEFTTYGRSRDPSSDPHSNDRSSRSSSPHQGTYDAHGYAMSGGYSGSTDLRRRMARNGESSSSYGSARARSGGSRGGVYDPGRRSGLREEVYAESLSAREQQQREQREMQREYMQRERRRTGRGEYIAVGRSGRRGAVTAANDEYLAYVQAEREQRQREYDERPANVRRYGRGYFPAYEWR